MSSATDNIQNIIGDDSETHQDLVNRYGLFAIRIFDKFYHDYLGKDDISPEDVEMLKDFCQLNLNEKQVYQQL
ncbi:hypothetical protein BGZ76_002638, partial [Entomortierella beljakovae]